MILKLIHRLVFIHGILKNIT